MLWNRSLVMRDLETESLWSHILGECMRGELKGEKLELIPAVMMTWGDWVADNPETTVLDMRPTAKRFDKEFYKDASKFLYGVKVADQAKGYSFSFLQEHPVVQEEVGGVPVLVTYDSKSTSAVIFEPDDLSFKDALVDGELVERLTGSKFDPVSGVCFSGKYKGKRLEKLAGLVSYRKAWQTFYPESEYSEPN